MLRGQENEDLWESCIMLRESSKGPRGAAVGGGLKTEGSELEGRGKLCGRKGAHAATRDAHTQSSH